jgi:hypothetical protein
MLGILAALVFSDGLPKGNPPAGYTLAGKGLAITGLIWNIIGIWNFGENGNLEHGYVCLNHFDGTKM